MAIERVVGYVDGQPVIYQEQDPTQYETTTEAEEKRSYDIEITAEDDHGNQGMVRSIFYVAGEWIEPVVDRILQDLREKNDRAYLNYWDLNRIEMDIEYLSDLLNGYGYRQEVVSKTDWTDKDFPYSEEMERIRSNIQVLLDTYYTQAVSLPDTLEELDYIKLNAVENNLKLMYEMIGRMEQSFKHCGTFYCGQAVVP